MKIKLMILILIMIIMNKKGLESITFILDIIYLMNNIKNNYWKNISLQLI